MIVKSVSDISQILINSKKIISNSLILDYIIQFDYLLIHYELSINAKKVFQTEYLSYVLSLLSDSNQRPRDYKSRALAN